MKQIVSAASLFLTACDFLAAVDMLSPKVAAGPFGFVAAQSLELALKAYLMKNAGATEQELKKLGHSIERAWSRCVDKGLGLDATLPAWVVSLAAGHESPYLFRYGQDGTEPAVLSKINVGIGLQDVLQSVQAATGLEGRTTVFFYSGLKR
jgi:hypothetical protein